MLLSAAADFGGNCDLLMRIQICSDLLMGMGIEICCDCDCDLILMMENCCLPMGN
jgi:hypothetical protein